MLIAAADVSRVTRLVGAGSTVELDGHEQVSLLGAPSRSDTPNGPPAKVSPVPPASRDADDTGQRR